MAAFTQRDAYGQPLDWTILRDGGVALYWRRDLFDNDIEWFRQQHYQIFPFDCSRWVSSEDMHTDLQRALAFPAYYGKNLHALNDCLGDLQVPEDGGTALALIRFDRYIEGPGGVGLASGRSEAEGVLDMFARASRFFMLTARHFITLVQTDNPRTHFDSLACVSACWNRREWLNKNRGL